MKLSRSGIFIEGKLWSFRWVLSVPFWFSLLGDIFLGICPLQFGCRIYWHQIFPVFFFAFHVCSIVMTSPFLFFCSSPPSRLRPPVTLIGNLSISFVLSGNVLFSFPSLHPSPSPFSFPFPILTPFIFFPSLLFSTPSHGSGTWTKHCMHIPQPKNQQRFIGSFFLLHSSFCPILPLLIEYLWDFNNFFY